MLWNWLWLIPLILVIAFVYIAGRYFRLWLRGYFTRARVGLFTLFFMSLRRVNPAMIVDAKILAVQAGLTAIPTATLEAHYLAGGNIKRVTQALVAAHRAQIPLDWNTAAAIDLAGRDVLEAVQVSVNPLVIDCPEPGNGRSDTLDGVAKDGIQLKVKVRVTVRTNLAQLIGGSTEATVIARVGEGIVSAIGSCENYRMALANPMLIAGQVLAKGLDSQTAYSIVSIDIADIDVGENIGARLQVEQADANIRIARATAERRRAMAIAHQQEMLALTQANRAAVVLAEAGIPAGMAEAFTQGHLGKPGQRSTLSMNRSLRPIGLAATGSVVNAVT